jgi:hypothetical protein
VLSAALRMNERKRMLSTEKHLRANRRTPESSVAWRCSKVEIPARRTSPSLDDVLRTNAEGKKGIGNETGRRISLDRQLQHIGSTRVPVAMPNVPYVRAPSTVNRWLRQESSGARSPLAGRGQNLDISIRRTTGSTLTIKPLLPSYSRMIAAASHCLFLY